MKDLLNEWRKFTEQTEDDVEDNVVNLFGDDQDIDEDIKDILYDEIVNELLVGKTLSNIVNAKSMDGSSTPGESIRAKNGVIVYTEEDDGQFFKMIMKEVSGHIAGQQQYNSENSYTLYLRSIFKDDVVELRLLYRNNDRFELISKSVIENKDYTEIHSKISEFGMTVRRTFDSIL